LELLEFPFGRMALAEVLLLAVGGGLAGAWIVVRRLAFFAHGTAGSAFPGLVAADAAGIAPLAGGLAAAAAYATGAGAADARDRERSDGPTALLLVAALALGAVLASDVARSGQGVESLLFGGLLGTSGAELGLAATAAVVALAGTLTLGPLWMASAFDPRGMRALGLPKGVADAALYATIALAVVAALPALGALLAGFVLMPAATLALVARRPGVLLFGSVALAAVEGVAGLLAAFWLDLPPGPVMASLGALAFMAAGLVAAPGRQK